MPVSGLPIFQADMGTANRRNDWNVRILVSHDGPIDRDTAVRGTPSKALACRRVLSQLQKNSIAKAPGMPQHLCTDMCFSPGLEAAERLPRPPFRRPCMWPFRIPRNAAPSPLLFRTGRHVIGSAGFAHRTPTDVALQKITEAPMSVLIPQAKVNYAQIFYRPDLVFDKGGPDGMVIKFAWREMLWI